MTFTNFLYNILQFTLLFGFNVAIFSTFKAPQDPTYFLVASIFFAVAVFMHKQLLSFLAVRKAFPTRLIAISLLVAVVFFIMETILPGFAIDAWNMKGISLGVINIAPMEFSKYVTMAIIATFDGLIGSAMYSLDRK